MKNRIFKNCFSVVMALVMALSLNCAAFATYTNGPRNTHYDRDLAADYVADYTTTANSEYTNYVTVDCTNFASQVWISIVTTSCSVLPLGHACKQKRNNRNLFYRKRPLRKWIVYLVLS